MSEPKIEPCLICDGEMKHTKPGTLALWYCENHDDCDYRFVDCETNIAYHNDRYEYVQVGKRVHGFVHEMKEFIYRFGHNRTKISDNEFDDLKDLLELYLGEVAITDEEVFQLGKLAEALKKNPPNTDNDYSCPHGCDLPSIKQGYLLGVKACLDALEVKEE